MWGGGVRAKEDRLLDLADPDNKVEGGMGCCGGAEGK